MKKIKLENVSAVILGTNETISYKALTKAIIESPSDQNKGANIDEIRKSIRVLEALDAADDWLELEDADYDYAMHRVKDARFVAASQVFIDYVESFENAA